MVDTNRALWAILCAATSHYEREGNVMFLYPAGDGDTMTGIMLKDALELAGNAYAEGRLMIQDKEDTHDA